MLGNFVYYSVQILGYPQEICQYNNNMISLSAYFSQCHLSQSFFSPQIYRLVEEMTKHFYSNQRLHLNCLHLNHKKTPRVVINFPLSREMNKCHFTKLDGEQVVTECYLGGLYLLSKTTIYILTGRIIRYSSIEVL